MLVQSNTATHVLDLVLVSSFFRDHINTSFYPHLLSDHYIIISELTLPRMASPLHHARWKTESANWNLFQTHISNWANNYMPYPAP